MKTRWTRAGKLHAGDELIERDGRRRHARPICELYQDGRKVRVRVRMPDGTNESRPPFDDRDRVQVLAP